MGNQPPNGQAESQRKLLVVDDEVKICRLLAEHFSLQGYEVRTVCRGEEALALVHAFHPDVVLLDLLMPGLSGVETLRVFKQLTPPPKVIMISAADHERVVRGALNLGVDFYVCKPIKLAELDPLINSFYPSTPKRPSA